MHTAATSEERLNMVLNNATEIGERMLASMFGKKNTKSSKQQSDDKATKQRRGKS